MGSSVTRPIPRKVPRQERSRQTVERILDAAGRVLVASGYDGASTHRIAEEAGVSPGSVYQYFPNKDVIVHMAVERMVGQISERLVEAIADAFVADPLDGVRTMVSAVLTTTEEHRELTRVLVEQLPRLGGSTAIPAFERRGMDQVQGYLLAMRPRGDPRHAAADAWIVTQAVQQLVTRYVLDEPAIDRETFVDALTRLVIGFFGSAAVAPS